MNIRSILSIILLAAVFNTTAQSTERLTSEPIKSIPLPPEGKRWVVNEQFSDEFNGKQLDDSKWFEHHPNWKGREPGLFESKNISFENGCMVLKGEKMDRDTVVRAYGRELTFNISCAAVVSKTQEAHYGYYECRVKANKTTLSTTFWLSSQGGAIPTEGNQPEGAEPGKFSQELDICECIGRGGDFKGSFFSEGMNSNVHYWFRPDSSVVNKGSLDIRIPDTRLKRADGGKPSDDFNIYGCWWRDKSNASFYLNNGDETNRNFAGRLKWGKPYDIEFNFTKPMRLNMVVETYPFPWIPLPNDEELADPKLNRSYYDWVRSYILVDSEEANKRGTAAMQMFQTAIHMPMKFDSHPKGTTRNIELHYTAPTYKSIEIVIFDKSGSAIANKSINGYAGYANLSVDINLNNLASGAYTLVCYIGESGKRITDNYEQRDSFNFVVR